MRPTPFPPLTVFIWWLSGLCPYVCASVSLYGICTVPLRTNSGKIEKYTVHKVQIILWDCPWNIPTSTKPSGHSSRWPLNQEMDFWLFPVCQRANSLLLLLPSGHPINLRSQNLETSNTLWVSRGERHLPNVLDFLPLWTLQQWQLMLCCVC